ncbi:MAG: DUF1573 domain-containing protein [Candidatus Cyclobacteriaceae bacterium M2_1C_046]
MNLIKLLFIAFFAVATVACSDRDAEKRIAELESRLAEIEGQNSPKTPTKVQAEPEVKPEGPLPAFTFTETEYDFGTINEGDKVKHTFTFTNTGDAALIIQNASGSCGCTVPTYSKEPIAPGESGEIVAEFNSKGQKNQQIKTVRVTANTWPKQHTLKIRAMVTPLEATTTTEASSGPVRK